MQSDCLPHRDDLTEVELSPGQHIVLRDGYVTIDLTVTDWCREMAANSWSYEIKVLGFKSRIADRYKIIFQFRSKQDAVLFKLTWTCSDYDQNLFGS